MAATVQWAGDYRMRTRASSDESRAPVVEPRISAAVKPRWRGRAPALLAYPDLGAAEQRKPHEAAYLQLLAACDRAQRCRIHLAAGGIQDLAAFPLVATALHAPQDHHSLDRLVLALAAAFLAQRIGTAGGGQDLR